MSKIKYPEVREIISKHTNLIKEYNLVSYLEYASYFDKPTPTLITNDDGVILAVADKNGITSDEHWEHLQKCCSDIAQNHNELTFTDYDYLCDIRRCANGRRQKQYRCNLKVQFLLQSNCNFLTLTFKPSVLDNTTEKTRRRYVIDFLNTLNCSYLGNIDYGRKNGREHYHVLVNTIDVNYSNWHKYGAIKGETIKPDVNPLNLTRYICKLSNHSIKATTKGQRVISKIIKDV